MQRVFVFFIKQDFPPAVTLLPNIFAPLELVGNFKVTVILTLPLLALDEETFATIGATGFETLTFACALGVIARLSTRAKLRLSWGNLFM